MSAPFVAPAFLREIGPAAFTRQVERLLLHLGFTDVTNIDGPDDQGGDLLATRGGRLWVFQAKWKSSGTVAASALDEVINAKAYYRADRSAVVTNAHFGPSTRKRRDELKRGGVSARRLRRNPADKILVVAHTKELVEQLERALWYHLPKDVRTQLLTGEHRPDDLRGITFATVASALSYVRAGFKPGLVMIDEAHHVAEDGHF